VPRVGATLGIAKKGGYSVRMKGKNAEGKYLVWGAKRGLARGGSSTRKRGSTNLLRGTLPWGEKGAEIVEKVGWPWNRKSRVWCILAKVNENKRDSHQQRTSTKGASWGGGEETENPEWGRNGATPSQKFRFKKGG